jgi:hypothetical protein
MRRAAFQTIQEWKAQRAVRAIPVIDRLRMAVEGTGCILEEYRTPEGLVTAHVLVKYAGLKWAGLTMPTAEPQEPSAAPSASQKAGN